MIFYFLNMTHSPDNSKEVNSNNNQGIRRYALSIVGSFLIAVPVLFPQVAVITAITSSCPDVSTQNGIRGLFEGIPQVYAGLGITTTGVIADAVGAQDAGNVLVGTGTGLISEGIAIGVDTACGQ